MIDARFSLFAMLALTSCAEAERQEDAIVHEAREAAKDGRIINNDAMVQFYPETFQPGRPPYLERDFEAGADMICDEIEREHGQDLCAQEAINWRN